MNTDPSQLLGQPVQVEPSTLFDHASIGSIDRSSENGMIVAHFGLSELFAAMVLDFGGNILMAQYPIGWHGIPQVMSPPDLASLARFLIKAAPADPLFKQLLADVQAHL